MQSSTQYSGDASAPMAARAPSTSTASLLGFAAGNSSTNYRLDNGYTEGPRKSQWGPAASSRAIQAMVTATVDVNMGLLEQRMNNMEAVDESRRIGIVRGPADVQIHEHELMFGAKSSGPGRFGSSGFGFTSFNGFDTSPFATQDDFEDNFRFLGRAKIDFYFGSGSQADNGVSVQLRGACSTANRGRYTFTPGERVAFSLPSIFKAQRAEEAKETHMPYGMEESKELCSLVPVTYELVHRLPRRAYKRYLEEARTPDGDEKLRVRQSTPSSQTRHADRLVRFAITYLRAAGMAKLYAGLCVLVEKGIVAIQAPTEAVQATYGAALEAANAPLAPQTAVQRQQAERLVGLAYMLDLVEARPRDTWLKPAATLIADVIEVQARGLAAATTSSEFSRLPLSRFVAEAAAGPAFTKGGALDAMQVNAVRREVQSFCETKRREDEKIIGVALSSTGPGEIIDLVL